MSQRVIHICHLFPTFEPGGAEVRTTMVINGLPEGFRHTVIAMDGQTSCAARLRPGVPCEVVTLPRGRGGRRTPWRIGGEVKRLGADLVATYNWGSIDAVIGIWLRRVKPWIHVQDGFPANEARGQLGRRALLRRIFYGRAAALVVVSNGLVRLARESWNIREDRLLRIANGIDLAHFAPRPAPETRRLLGAGESDLIVGNVAHIRPEKNVRRLVEAFLRIAGRHPRARLVFVGGIPTEKSGDAWEHYRAVRERVGSSGLGERIRFVGGVRETADYYRAFDLFALSSDSEQMPLSVMEAMATGLPIVATDVGETREMVSPSNREFVTRLDDENAYAAALDRLLSDAALRARLAAANRERAAAEFDQGRMVHGFQELYERLCARV